MWSTHIMEYDSAFKRRETDTSNNRMKLEDIVLSEISQPQMNKYYMIELL